MRRVIVATAIISAFLWPSDVFAMTGSELIGPCQDYLSGKEVQNTYLKQGVCYGIVLTVYQVHPAMMDKWRICPPDGVTMDQMIRIVFKYLNDNPKELHKEFSFLAHMALRDAFPCK